MMSAMQKLGTKDYICAAIINPSVIRYKAQVMRLAKSSSEMGIHGGYNHALWHKFGADWDESKVKAEVQYALKNIRSVVGEYEPTGFASPGWTSPHCLPKVLKELGFDYYADLRCKGEDRVMDKSGILPCIGVNLLGEPSGIAYFENCRVSGRNDLSILKEVRAAIKHNEHTVLYDHPYYAGINELAIIRKIIILCKEENVEIVTLGEML